MLQLAAGCLRARQRGALVSSINWEALFWCLKQALASMSAVNITAVNVLDNPTYFTNPMQFEIQYECLHDLQHGARPAFVNNTTPASHSVLLVLRVCLSGAPFASVVLSLLRLPIQRTNRTFRFQTWSGSLYMWARRSQRSTTRSWTACWSGLSTLASTGLCSR